MCSECGVRGLVLPGSAQWFDNYAVCEACQRQRSLTCGVCSEAAAAGVTLQCCGTCHRSDSAPHVEQQLISVRPGNMSDTTLLSGVLSVDHFDFGICYI